MFICFVHIDFSIPIAILHFSEILVISKHKWFDCSSFTSDALVLIFFDTAYREEERRSC